MSEGKQIGVCEAFGDPRCVGRCRDPRDCSAKPLPAQKPLERFTIGRQPCQAFLRGDADIAALGEGNRRNLHQCPKCEGNRAWCDNCHGDHHDGGWETCQPGAYAELTDAD